MSDPIRARFEPDDGPDARPGDTVVYLPGREPEPWPEPEPLPTALPPVDPFAADLLPDALRPWIGDIAERMQCPPDYPAVGAMVTLSSVVGRQVGIRPKRHDDWTVVPNLWGCVVGRPSLLKTPALQEPIGMVEVLEAMARKAHEDAERDHAADALVAEANKTVAKNKVAKAVKEGNTALAHALAAEVAVDPDPPVRRWRRATHHFPLRQQSCCPSAY